MSNVRFQRLERRGARRLGDRLELEMSLPKTPSGMEARWCPLEDCAPRLFQLGETTSDAEWNGAETRLHRTPHTFGTTCPYCGHDSADDHEFIDPRDVEALTTWFKWAAQEDVLDAVGNMLRGVGRRLPRSGPISIQVSVARGLAAAADMQRLLAALRSLRDCPLLSRLRCTEPGGSLSPGIRPDRAADHVGSRGL